MDRKPIVLGALTALLLAGNAFANKDFNVGDKLKEMKKELALTDAQVNAIDPILNDYKNKIDAAADEKEQRLSSILSADQMKQWKQMKAAHRK